MGTEAAPSPAVGDEKIPPVSLSPFELERMTKRLVATGANVRKANREGRFAAKLLTIDERRTRLQYHPTAKQSPHNSIPFADLWRIDIGEEAALRAPKGAEIAEGEDHRILALTAKDGTRWILICTSSEQRTSLAQTLALMVSGTRPVAGVNMLQDRIIRVWLDADTDRSGSIEVEELIAVLPANGFCISDEAVRVCFKQFDADNSGTLEFDEFTKLFESLVLRPELQPLFDSFAEDGVMRADGVQRFFGEAQGEPITLSLARKRLSLMTRGRSADAITPADFFAYLTDVKGNSWLRPEHEAVHQDMTQPLHHYYIMSSHNSALDGDQLASNASPQWLEMVLRQGYRCIELEVFDGPDGSPVISRSYAKCKPCPTDRIVDVLQKNAFVTTDFPLILIVELHTSSLAQSGAFTQQLEAAFPGMIYTRDEALSTDFSQFSPLQLKGKVLVMSSAEGVPSPKSIEDSREHRILRERGLVAPTPPFFEPFDRLVSLHLKSDVGLSDLLPQNTVLHITDNLQSDLFQQKLFKAIDLNRRMFTRSYPVRSDSSNITPVPAFAAGTQLCSMNVQSCDEHLRLYESRFQVNGKCGYVLKPLFMRRLKSQPNPKPYIVTVVIVMALQLPRPLALAPGDFVSPRVKMTAFGCGDGTVATKTTQIVPNNGFCPYFGESFTFRVRGIDLALMRLTVEHVSLSTRGGSTRQQPANLHASMSNMNASVALTSAAHTHEAAVVPIGEASIPLTSLRVGYRAVELRSCDTGAPLERATVLCHFTVAEATRLE